MGLIAKMPFELLRFFALCSPGSGNKMHPKCMRLELTLDHVGRRINDWPHNIRVRESARIPLHSRNVTNSNSAFFV